MLSKGHNYETEPFKAPDEGRITWNDMKNTALERSTEKNLDYLNLVLLERVGLKLI